MSRRLLIAVLVVVGALTGAAGALAAVLHTETASAGGVTATFTYRGAQPMVSDAHLQIAQGGQALYDAAVTSPACGQLCGPAEFGPQSKSVGVVPLLPGSPQVVLELYSGGANCCFIDQIFSYRPGTRTYVKTEHDFADAGATLKRLRGQWRFVSSDPGFKYAFTDGADSGEPLQIWRFSAGQRFVDVTRGYPGMLRHDAAFWWRIYRSHRQNGNGVLAAWAGDEELLGHDRLVQSTLRAELAAGHLKAPSGGGWPSGARFIRALNRLLVKLHYKG